MKTTIYEYLLEKQAKGEMQALFLLGVNPNVLTYMEVYQYYQNHPKESLAEISYQTIYTKTTIYRIIKLMETIVP